MKAECSSRTKRKKGEGECVENTLPVAGLSTAACQHFFILFFLQFTLTEITTKKCFGFPQSAKRMCLDVNLSNLIKLKQNHGSKKNTVLRIISR